MSVSKTLSIRLKNKDYQRLESFALRYKMSPNEFTKRFMENLLSDELEIAERNIRFMEDLGKSLARGTSLQSELLQMVTDTTNKMKSEYTTSKSPELKLKRRKK